VVALAGVSYAAGVLPSNSVGSKQLKKNAVTGVKVKNGTLTAADFKSGQLAAGPKGEPGAKGDAGAPGTDGASGRSALTPLQSGESESGVFAVGGPESSAGDIHISPVSFAIPLSHSVDANHVVAVGGASAAHCPAQGQADPGYLCVYSGGHSAELNALISDDIRDPAQVPNSGADKHGFFLKATANAATNFAGVAGTWTYTEA